MDGKKRPKTASFSSLENASKSHKSHSYYRWNAKDIRYLQSHAYMTARELANHFGCTVNSVNWARKHYGRYDAPSARYMCVACEERVVWEESKSARRLRLCKGCYLKEQEMRSREELRANAARQRTYKAVHGATSAGQSAHGQHSAAGARPPEEPKA